MKMILIFLVTLITTGCATGTKMPDKEFEFLKADLAAKPLGKELMGAYKLANKDKVCECIGAGSVTLSSFSKLTGALWGARIKAEKDLALCVETVKASGSCSGVNTMVYAIGGDEVIALAFLGRPIERVLAPSK